MFPKKCERKGRNLERDHLFLGNYKCEDEWSTPYSHFIFLRCDFIWANQTVPSLHWCFQLFRLSPPAVISPMQSLTDSMCFSVRLWMPVWIHLTPVQLPRVSFLFPTLLCSCLFPQTQTLLKTKELGARFWTSKGISALIFKQWGFPPV